MYIDLMKSRASMKRWSIAKPLWILVLLGCISPAFAIIPVPPPSGMNREQYALMNPQFCYGTESTEGGCEDMQAHSPSDCNAYWSDGGELLQCDYAAAIGNCSAFVSCVKPPTSNPTSPPTPSSSYSSSESSCDDAVVNFYNHTEDSVVLQITAYSSEGGTVVNTSSVTVPSNSKQVLQAPVTGSATYYVLQAYSAANSSSESGDAYNFSISFVIEVSIDTADTSCSYTTLNTGYPQETSNPNNVPFHIAYLNDKLANIYIDGAYYNTTTMTFTWVVDTQEKGGNYSQVQGEYLAAQLANQLNYQLRALTNQDSLGGQFEVDTTNTVGSFDVSSQTLTLSADLTLAIGSGNKLKSEVSEIPSAVAYVYDQHKYQPQVEAY